MFKRIFLIINLFFILVGCYNNNDIVIDYPETSDSNTVIIVDIKGAVKIPGLYSVEKGVMLYEIINLAGGLLSNADRDGINLIQVFNNNTSINIPYISNNSSSKLININYASIEELMTLNGIGEVKAKAIIEYRNQNTFTSIEDIMKVSGISESVFNKIKDDITV
jgi:competence protein ComEA